MPGSPASYLNTGNSALTKMLNTPIPGLDSPGFDTLSTSYDSAEQSGISDIASRGLTTTGATPSMYRDLNAGYARGSGQVVASGAAQQEQQRLAILNALLGLGSSGLNVSRAGTGSTLEDIAAGGDVATGLFGAPTGANFLSGQLGSSGGLLSTGYKDFLKQIGFGA